MQVKITPMKSLLHSTRLVPLAAVLLSTALAGPTSATAKELNVHGSLDASEVQTVTPPTMLIELEGSGNASHLGRFVVKTEAMVFLPTFFGEGTFEIETPSGARVFGTLTGQGSPTPDSNFVPVEETLTITGGTGRFTGATGTLTIHRVIDRLTKISTGTIEGTILLPDPPRK